MTTDKSVITKYPPSVRKFVKELRTRHDDWQSAHDYDEGMRGGYGNPLLAIELMERIENLADGGNFERKR